MAPGILEDLSPKALILKHHKEAEEDQELIKGKVPVENIKCDALLKFVFYEAAVDRAVCFLLQG
jgi:hypothetical protein